MNSPIELEQFVDRVMAELEKKFASEASTGEARTVDAVAADSTEAADYSTADSSHIATIKVPEPKWGKGSPN